MWLSKEVGIDELSSLRIVVLEWQARPAVQILQESTDSQLDNLARNDTLQKATCGTKPLGGGDTDSNSDSRVRHSRILQFYISERQYILKVAGFVVFQTVCKGSSERKGKSVLSDEGSSDDFSWLDPTGTTIIHSWLLDKTGRRVKSNWLITATAALQSRLEALRDGSGWFKDSGGDKEIEVAWTENQPIEMIHIMQLMFILIQSNPDIPRSDVVLEWFRFMYRCSFLEHLQLVS